MNDDERETLWAGDEDEEGGAGEEDAGEEDTGEEAEGEEAEDEADAEDEDDTPLTAHWADRLGLRRSH